LNSSSTPSTTKKSELVRPTRGWVLTDKRLIVATKTEANGVEVVSVPTPGNPDDIQTYVGFAGILSGLRHGFETNPVEGEEFQGATVLYDNGAELSLGTDQPGNGIQGDTSQKLTTWQVDMSGIDPKPAGRRIDKAERDPMDVMENIMDGVSSLWNIKP
jgi:hypothetical protein